MFLNVKIFSQYYLYATDPRIKRIGMQCWIYMAVCALEAAICIKFGRTQLPAIQLKLITVWILFLVRFFFIKDIFRHWVP